MAKAISTSSGQKVIGETVIRNLNCEKCHIPRELIEWEDGNTRQCPKCGGNVGEFVVRFSSLDAETPWGQRFEAARIKYAMLHKYDKIPSFLRTGKCFFLVKITATLILERKLKKEVNANG